MDDLEFKQRALNTGTVIASIALAAFIWLGRWEGIGGGERATYFIDRWTGDVYVAYAQHGEYEKLEEAD